MPGERERTCPRKHLVAFREVIFTSEYVALSKEIDLISLLPSLIYKLGKRTLRYHPLVNRRSTPEIYVDIYVS